MGSELIEIIKAASNRLFPSMVEIRRDLHQHPELSFDEKRTSSQIRHFLNRHGIPYSEGWAGHGIVAIIKGDHPGPMVMLRADMDALPILEKNNVDYKSVHDGLMHACGHDVHTTSLLGVAAVINENKKNLHGEVRMIFQPGEEKLPGGASIMIREGLFEPDKPQWMLGQHVFPQLQAGHIGFRSGVYMASADEVYITIKGKGGHAATPHLCIDPIVISARLITALQEVISRNIDPLTPGVFTIGRIYSDGGATNVIPETVFLEGTLRSVNEPWRYKAHDLIRNHVKHITEASGATGETRILIGYPSLENNEEITSMCRQSAIAFLGEERVHELPQRMTSEDFAFYSQQVPATFYRLGTGWPDEERNFPVHSNQFDINENALETGIGLMSYIVLSNLSGSKE
jgi:amidohydrolase